MRIQDIKTEKEFLDLSDNWYQRSKRLSEIWQNIEESRERREKAFRLCMIMYGRVLKLAGIANKIRIPNPPAKFEKGSLF